jgi:replication factor A1
MTEIDQLFERVLKESGKNTEEIRAMIDKRKAATHGLLSDYGALYAVAKELGVEMGGDRITITKISDVKPKGSYNVAGRVAMVYPPKDFQKKDGGTGKIASLILSDGSGETRLVLWDANAEFAVRTKPGDIVLARNAYGKEGLKGNVELQAGNMSNILINPKMSLDLPDFKREIIKAANLTKDMNNLSMVLRVLNIYPPVTFVRPDGKEGVRASFTAEDESGMVRVVLWGEAAKTKLERGDVVRIDSAYTKEGLKGGLELHIGGRGTIEKTEEKLSLKPLESSEGLFIKQVKPDMQNLSLTARVVRVYEPRAYSNGMMASMVIGDGTGTIRVVVWNEKANSVSELKRGDTI